jgi:hypothetical protein
MNCRPGCGACCIAPSISTLGKPAGVRCLHLDEHHRCRLFGKPERPAVCVSLRPSAQMCGDNREQALLWLRVMEESTAP